MKRNLAALLAGFMFAIGLALSGMTRPSKVLGFLDIAGAWDPSLLLVMVGAIGVYATAYWSTPHMKRSVLGETFVRPTASDLDARLVVGAVVFGIGWGLVGYCPGPAIVSLGAGMLEPFVFVAAMCAGLWITRAIDSRVRSA